MAARIWTESQRIAQGQAIKRWKPWKSATGPRTTAGKAKISRNSLKHGCNSRWVSELRALERSTKELDSDNVLLLDELDRVRLEVSKLIADTAMRRGEPRSLIKAYRFLSIQLTRFQSSLFPLPPA